ncbi:3-hydroxy-fatty acyl-ACP dehydratase [Tatumella sp. OPLPL6]|uniref:ApeP family dehydratase n=1 Tax=Tatumella sp. OPLPL6 TaxID=1928657 RepID=UPI000C193689|nr:3-hydroxy-fatty acyl-ACP dehydratase [Tatumella sp. OPLPL6]PIJ44353.1 3-hydroxy-fatty acyl-ACP dehydratase [Tatumella sp. OPLPL6]
MTPYASPGEYLPHESPMVLLDEVIAVATQHAICRSHVSAFGALAPFLQSDGTLPGWYALEMMAQTVGVWNGWHNQQKSSVKPALGMILGARDLSTCSPFFEPNQVLEIRISLLMQDGRMASFDAAIYHEDRCLSQGRINTYQPNSDELAFFFKEE